MSENKIAYQIKNTTVYRTVDNEDAEALIQSIKDQSDAELTKIVKEYRKFNAEDWYRVLLTKTYGTERTITENESAAFPITQTDTSNIKIFIYVKDDIPFVTADDPNSSLYNSTDINYLFNLSSSIYGAYYRFNRTTIDNKIYTTTDLESLIADSEVTYYEVLASQEELPETVSSVDKFFIVKEAAGSDYVFSLWVASVDENIVKKLGYFNDFDELKYGDISSGEETKPETGN